MAGRPGRRAAETGGGRQGAHLHHRRELAAGDAEQLDPRRGHRRVRRRTRPRLGHAPAGDADRGRNLRRAEAADRHLLRGRAGRSSSSTRTARSCRAGARATKDNPTDWPRNPHGIFVDHNDFVWVGTYMHHRVMKFTREGKLVMTIGQYDKNAGSNDTTLLGGPVRHLGRSEDQRGVHRRRLPQPPRRRLRRRDRQVPAPLGRLRREAGRHGEVRPEDDGRAARCRSSSRPCTASPDRRTGRSTWPIAAAIASRCSISQGKFVAEKIIAPATLSSGSAFVLVLSTGRAAAVALPRRRHQSQGLDPAAQQISRSSASSAAAAVRSASSCARTG